ncbi:hypothetical protein BDR05DRAFT_964838 [Suillus weaverae]|nr:hypothetical protein BDR05DRAFT_964838 [Suillus weaverae]
MPKHLLRSIGYHPSNLASALQVLYGGISSLNAIVIHPQVPPLAHSHPLIPVINASFIASYFLVVRCAGIMYDCVLTFGQEVGQSISGAANSESLRIIL